MTFAYKTCLRITAVLGGDDAIQWASWHRAEPDLKLFIIGWVYVGPIPPVWFRPVIIRHTESRVGIWMAITYVGVLFDPGWDDRGKWRHSTGNVNIVQYPHGH